MQHFFFDTCSLLNEEKKIFQLNEKFYISSITLKQLQNIKTSFNKDSQTKYQARKLINKLSKNKNKYQVILYQQEWDNQIKKIPVLSDNNDSRIIYSAIQLQKKENIIFVTQDICCRQIAAAAGLKVKYIQQEDTNYTGYITVQYNNDDEFDDLYEKIYSNKIINELKLHQNEYILIQDQNKRIVDKYKVIQNDITRVQERESLYSMMFGDIQPKDQYQSIAIDCLQSNKITLLRGKPGSGKSFLSLAFLFQQLERHQIDKIIIFCNTVATHGAAKLGYYSGSRTEKLLDSQIGNFLSSKLGDKQKVMEMIQAGTLVLLPMSDIRGYDTSGMKAGVYITQAQNMDIELMKLALQRVGQDGICILDGDDQAQLDLGMYAGSNNGLRRVSEVFRGQSIYGQVTLPNIYRSQIADIAERM